MGEATHFDEAIAQLKAKYPHRSEDLDFVVAHLPDVHGRTNWQARYTSVEYVIKREEQRDIEKAAAQAAGKKE